MRSALALVRPTPELRIDPPLLGQSSIEFRRLLVGPGSSEVIEIVVELTAGRGLPPFGLFLIHMALHKY
jgi:hypothetical protein